MVFFVFIQSFSFSHCTIVKPFDPGCEDYIPCNYIKSYPCIWDQEICNIGIPGSITFTCNNIPNNGVASLSYDVSFPSGGSLTQFQEYGGGNILDNFLVQVWNTTETQPVGGFLDTENQCWNLDPPYSEGTGCLIYDNSSPRSFGPKVISSSDSGFSSFTVFVSRSSINEQKCQTFISTVHVS